MTDDLKLIVAVAAAAGAMYGLVTRPLMALLKAEMATLKAELRLEMKDMEKRLSERIDAWVLRK